MPKNTQYDVVVVGGGFYGCCIALLMRDYYDRVAVIERSPDILLRASAVNQARVHSGFHYPRNLTTAYRSLVNFPRFAFDFRHAIVDDLVKLYAIARVGSKVNAQRFYRMFKDMKATIEPARQEYASLFEKSLIEKVFEVKEVVFDSDKLREMLKDRLAKMKVDILCEEEIDSVWQHDNGQSVLAAGKSGATYESHQLFNCTYSRINVLLDNSSQQILPLKHEITEICLVEMPDHLKHIGVTVMDGPFFSVMPYPTARLHSLTHVRYTPHSRWTDLDQLIDGYKKLEKENQETNFVYMRNDAQRYMPVLTDVQYVKSAYEVKTILSQNEADDGRPIMFKPNYGLNNFHIVMGSKIDNVYDLLEVIGEIKMKARKHPKEKSFFN